jgi:hypothetical protein
LDGAAAVRYQWRTSSFAVSWNWPFIYYAFIRRIQKEKKQVTIKNRLITESNYDDMTLQPGEDREFKNQFTEFLKKNMSVDEQQKIADDLAKKKKKRKKKTKSSLDYFMSYEDSATE